MWSRMRVSLILQLEEILFFHFFLYSLGPILMKLLLEGCWNYWICLPRLLTLPSYVFLFVLLPYVLGQIFRSIFRLTNMLFICVITALHQRSIFSNEANMRKLQKLAEGHNDQNKWRDLPYLDMKTL